jgi:hypothetical protein
MTVVDAIVVCMINIYNKVLFIFYMVLKLQQKNSATTDLSISPYHNTMEV